MNVKGVFEAEYLKLNSKSETFVSLKKEILPFTVEYKKMLEVKVPKLGLVYKKEDNTSTVILFLYLIILYPHWQAE